MEFTQCHDPRSVVCQDVADALPSRVHSTHSQLRTCTPALHTHASQQICSLSFSTMLGRVGLGPTRTLAHAWLLSTLTRSCFPGDQLSVSLTLASPFLAYGDRSWEGADPLYRPLWSRIHASLNKDSLEVYRQKLE